MTIQIKNWDDFQHFKNRDPIWIKLYRRLLDDKEWHRLDGDSAKCLVMLWLLASEGGGYLPDISTISFRLRIPEEAVSGLISKLSHWIDSDDIGAISVGNQEAIPEKRREEKRAKKKTDIPKDFQISDRVISWAESKGHHSLQAHFENFVSVAKAKGYTYADWDEAFMRAIKDNWAKVQDKSSRRVAV